MVKGTAEATLTCGDPCTVAIHGKEVPQVQALAALAQ